MEFGTRTAGEIMTPRVRTVSLEANDRASAVIELARQTGHSRFPVLDDDEVVVGTVHVKHAVALPVHERATTRVKHLMAKPIVVPDSLRLDPLLALLRAGRLPDGRRPRRVRRPGRHRHPRGRDRGDRRRHRRRARPAGRPRPASAATAPGRSPGCCAPTRSRTSPASSCPSTRTTTRSPGSCCGCSAGCPSVGDVAEVAGARPLRPRRADRERLAVLTVEHMDGLRIDRLAPAGARRSPTGRGREATADERRDRVLLVALLLLLGNAFFVAAEFALVSARRTQIEPRAEAGSRVARTTLRAMENISLVIGVNQLGITVCSLVLGAVGEPAVAHLLEPRAARSLHVPESFLHPVAFVIGLALVVYLHVVLGEMIPKNIALAGPDRAALVLGPADLGDRHRAAPGDRGDQRARLGGPAARRGAADGRGQLDVHPRGGRRAGRGVARRGAARGRRVRPARRRAGLHREDRRPRS